MTPTEKSKPQWLKAPLPSGERYRSVKLAVNGHGLKTVCQEARCPNLGECWNRGTATFMILGDTCTRGCDFCAVKRGASAAPPPACEAMSVAKAAKAMGLDYVVVTSVTRDDLPDGGAGVFAEVIKEVRALHPSPMVEVLTPDFLGEDLETVLDAGPTVFAHNIEVVERLSTSLRHGSFSYARSLECLAQASAKVNLTTKSSIMLGLGEDEKEILRSMEDLLIRGVKILVLGQYLQPTRSHHKVERYLPPEEFDRLAKLGTEMGFEFVAAGPLARTSYRAAEAHMKARA